MAKKKLTATVPVPDLLIEAVKTKRAILFLGAGASKEARDAANKAPPDADQLSDMLAQEFFRKPMPGRDAMAVAEMAIASGVGAPRVFEKVRTIFDPFQPGEAHKKIATFTWRIIATTNYDLLVERAYAETREKVQNLVRFVKDDEPIEDRLQAANNPVTYLKLHGCLDHIHDPDIPPVLSREHFASYLTNRTRLFGRLNDVARESSIIFVGYRLGDQHIRDLIYRLGPGQRPRWYIVTPDAEDYDVNFWATKNIEVIKARFGEFIDSLDSAIPALWRSLPQFDKVAELPIRKFFTTVTEELLTLRNALSTDLTFVFGGMPHEEQTAKRFYEGYDTGWGGIVNRFDVRRKIEDDLLFKALLEIEDPKAPVFFILRGAAGAGKTIALKRIAYEAAISNALVLWLQSGGALRSEVFAELYDLCKRPIYLFVDQVALHVDKVYRLLRAAFAKHMPLIVIGAERDADWNTYCGVLDTEFLPHLMKVQNLLRPEVEGLLDLLERHDCLGLLKGKSREVQLAEFIEKERADRQLLVALHELTQGKPFEEIIFNEHQRVSPESARQLYLDIATMHQFAVNVRAGTISRISGIRFADYEADFFAPLQDIVKVERDPYTGDYCYRTRHARVAYMVFRQVCDTDELKAKQFRRLISGLDIGYSADARALEEITRGRALVDAFAEPTEVRELYELAIEIAPTKAYIHQQWAIFELNHQQGSAALAEEHADRARELDPRRYSIIHTQAEVDRRRANEEHSQILKDSYRRRARERLNEMPSYDPFAVSSRCKLLVDEVAELEKALPEHPKQHEAFHFAEKVKDAETALQRAQENFPDDADIIGVEARLRKTLAQDDRALIALQRALAAGPRGSGIAIRVASVYQERGRIDDAKRVLEDALTKDQEDRSAHHAMALFYLNQDAFDWDIVDHHLRRSFLSGDQNFEARYTYAQFLFLKGDRTGAAELFEQIDKRAPEGFRRIPPRNDTAITKRLPRYSGSVHSIKDRFLFIRTGIYQRDIFAHFDSFNGDFLEDLSLGDEVNFRLRFNRSGPAAVDIEQGRLRS